MTPPFPSSSDKDKNDAYSRLPRLSTVGMSAAASLLSPQSSASPSRSHAHRYEPYPRPRRASTAHDVLTGSLHAVGVQETRQPMDDLRAVLPDCEQDESDASVLRKAVEHIRRLESIINYDAFGGMAESSRHPYSPSQHAPSSASSSRRSSHLPIRNIPQRAEAAIAASLGSAQPSWQKPERSVRASQGAPTLTALQALREGGPRKPTPSPASSTPGEVLASGMLNLSSIRNPEFQSQLLRLVPRLKTALERRGRRGGLQQSPLRASTLPHQQLPSNETHSAPAPASESASSMPSSPQATCNTIIQPCRSATSSPVILAANPSSPSPHSSSSIGSPGTVLYT